MTQSKSLVLSLSTIALIAACPALAQTTAVDLWAEWQEQATMSGQQVTGNVTTTSTGLTVSDVVTTYSDEDVMVTSSVAEVIMTETANGAVEVSLSSPTTLRIEFEDEPGFPNAYLNFDVAYENLFVLASGNTGARVYEYTADTITISDGEIGGGRDMPPEINFLMEMTDLQTTYRIFGTDPETLRFSSTGSLGGLRLNADVTPAPPEQGFAKLGFTMGPMETSGSGSILSQSALDAANGALPEGFSVDASLSYDSLAMEFDFMEPNEFLGRPDAFGFVYSNAGGDLAMDISSDGFSYDVTALETSTRVTAADVPFPIEFSTREIGAGFNIPLSASDTPQDFSMRVGIEDLTVAEEILSTFDPGQAIPRTPASLVLDLTGQVQVFLDIMQIGPEGVEGMPGELRALNLNEMRLSVGGADLTGSGALTFAAGQLVPMPVGSMDVALSGGNALLDALIAGGLVPAEQGAFVRGAANVFGRPGPTADTLQSTVVFGADGSITANGVPIQ